MFYEEQKREKQQDAMKERLAAEKKQKEALENNKDSLNDVDPWMKSKFADSEASKEETAAESTESKEETAEQVVEESAPVATAESEESKEETPAEN